MERRLVFWLILVAGALIRLVGLGSQGLWWDEAWQHHVVTSGGPSAFWERLMNPRITLNPPLYHLVSYAFAAPARALAGDVSDAWLRLPSALIGIAHLPLVRVLVQRLAPGRDDLALTTMALVALSPFHVYYSQEARMYTLVMALATAASIALVDALERGGIAAWARYTLACVASVYTHVHVAFGLLGHGVVVLALHRRRIGPFLVAAVLVAVTFLPVIGFFVERVGNLKTPHGGAGSPVLAVPYALFVYAAGLSMGPSVLELKAERSLALAGSWRAIAVVAAVFGPLLLAGAASRGVRHRGVLLAGLCAPLLGVSVAALAPEMTFNVRYTAWAFPFFAVLLALGLSAARSRSRVLGIVAALGVAGVFLVSNLARVSDPRYAREDVRGAVAAWRESGGASVLFSYNGSPTLERYLAEGEEMWHVPIYRRGNTEIRMRSVLSAAGARSGASERDTAYVLLARDSRSIVEGRVRGGFDVIGARTFPGGVTLISIEVPGRLRTSPGVPERAVAPATTAP